MDSHKFRFENLKNNNPIVNLLLIGTIFTRTASTMSVPFLAIYLTTVGHLSLSSAGLAIGISYLCGTFAGYLGGALSDKVGRKIMIITSLLLSSLSFIFLSILSDVYFLILFNVIQTVARSIFEPVSHALIAELTPSEKKIAIFSLRYTAINIGVSIGPIVGAFLSNSQTVAVPFFVSGVIYLLYTILLFFMIPTSQNQIKKSEVLNKGGLAENIGSVFKMGNSSLVFILLGGIIGMIGYSQLTTNLSNYVEINFKDGVTLYGLLMSLNAIVVIILQMPLSKYIEKTRFQKCIFIGNIFFAIGYIGFAFSTNWPLMFFSMFFFTAGEMLTFPVADVLIDKISPSHQKGMYFGAKNIINLGQFIGPWLGGVLLTISGPVLFLTMGILTVLDTLFYSIGIRKGGIHVNSNSSQTKKSSRVF